MVTPNLTSGFLPLETSSLKVAISIPSGTSLVNTTTTPNALPCKLVLYVLPTISITSSGSASVARSKSLGLSPVKKSRTDPPTR